MLCVIPQTSVIIGPLVLWLQGGPGWPSMYGMFKENGPFLIHVHKEGENVKNVWKEGNFCGDDIYLDKMYIHD